MSRIFLLDIPFDHVTLKEALQVVLDRLKKKGPKAFFIATPNPEMLLEARKDSSFTEVLNRSDLNIPDGMGIVFASRFGKNHLSERVTGTDLMQKICEEASHHAKIFLLGAAEGVAEKVKAKLESRYPHVRIVGTFSGSPDLQLEGDIRKRITESGAEILFVAFGAPKQEFWLARNLPHLPSVQVAMGVGGAFDFIAGIQKRAPRFMQKTGLEWLYRLIKQPSRMKRIYNATIKFPFVFLKDKLKSLF